MDTKLSTLVTTATTTAVKLMATAAWGQAQSAFAGLWRWVHPERVETAQADLQDSRTAVLAARQTGDEQVEQELVAEWQSRLGRLLAAEPQLVDELRHVVRQLRSALADAAASRDTTISLQATASGASRVNQAGRDLHVTIRE